MTIRTGDLTQQSRAARDTQRNIANIKDEITRHRRKVHDLTVYLNTLLPEPRITPETTWEKLQAMTEKALDKLKNSTNTPFVKPTRMRVRSPFHCKGETLTQQHAKDECDINIIIKKHAATGNISHLNPQTPLYADCTTVRDLQSAIELVEEAADNFATLPSAVRAACQNDPVQFVRMWDHPDGREQLAQAGLRFTTDTSTGGRDRPSKQPAPAPSDSQGAAGEDGAGAGEGKLPLTPQGGE